jgi:hypothetical protein
MGAARPQAALRLSTTITEGSTSVLEVRIRLQSFPAEPGDPEGPLSRMRLTLKALTPERGSRGLTNRLKLIAFEYLHEPGDLVDKPTTEVMNKATRWMIENVPLEISASWTDRGELQDIGIDIPDDPRFKGFERAQKEVIEQLVLVGGLTLRGIGAPLPREPVSAGARWRSPGAFTYNGITLDGFADYELTELTPEQARIRVRAALSHPRGPVTSPAFPADTAVEILTLEATEAGEFTIDRAREAISGGSITMSMKGQLHVRTADEEADVGFEAGSELRIAPK